MWSLVLVNFQMHTFKNRKTWALKGDNIAFTIGKGMKLAWVIFPLHMWEILVFKRWNALPEVTQYCAENSRQQI